MHREESLQTNSASTKALFNANRLYCDSRDFFCRIARIPKRFESATLENFDQPDKLRAKVLAVETLHSGRSITLTGAAGRGKTHLAIALAWHYWQHIMPKLPDGTHVYGTRPYYVCITDLMAALKEGFGNSDRVENERRLMEPILKSGLPIIDELQDGLTSTWSQDILYRIINGAYLKNTPVIVTSNAAFPKLITSNDYARVPDRLAEMGAIIELTGPSMRVQKQQEYMAKKLAAAAKRKR